MKNSKFSTPRHLRPRLLVLALSLAGLPCVYAQQVSADDIAQLRTELKALRAEQVSVDQRIQRVEDALARIAPEAESVATTATHPSPSTTITSTAVAAAAIHTTQVASPAPRLKINGDLRLRGQADWSDDDGKNRGSMQVRGRLGATYAITRNLTAGARVATGDADDPNSTDVQLSNWVDDLNVSLDMAYLQYKSGNWNLFGGKMPQPFIRTDLVWDGDVNPQGVAAVWRKAASDGSALRLAGLASVIDEQAAGPDSTLLGAQFGYETAKQGDWKFDVYASYYHYDLGSIAGADSGDFSSNLRGANGNYLSQFHLTNVLTSATYSGFGERWPLRIGAEYVRNTGAATDADSGYSTDLSLGRASNAGDWRVSYGYQAAQADAVLAAFSHDNIGIATDYRLHSLTIDYTPFPKTLLSAYWYHYRPHGALHAGGNQPNDWLDRLRLAFMVSF